MPELPDITVYVEAIRARVVGRPLETVLIQTPFLLRTVEPTLDVFIGRPVRSVGRLGKRIVVGFDEELFMVLHLMIAGRLHWIPSGKKGRKKSDLAAFGFPNGWLTLTEAGSKRRASLSLVRGRDAIAAIDRGGLEVLDTTVEQFAARLRSENHTIKRSLTDPRLFSGIGNAYSDEILHRARMSPVRLTSRLSDDEIGGLFSATIATLREWTDRLRADAGAEFPEKVTAFRPEMAVHGKYRQPCPVCGSPVQRIRYADNETNYCATCQTEGKLLADRALSRLLGQDWPRSLDEMEERLQV
jgi:formamidopyrimidine-DNA glycosylase